MKKKRFLLILLSLVMVSALTISVYAYMFHKTRTVSNVFTPAKVTCSVEEKFQNNKKTSIQVRNTGNVEAYIRVRLVFHWEDSKGNPVAWDMGSVNHMISYDDENWIKATDEDDTYYCKSPVKPNETTPNLFTENFFFEMKGQEVTEVISGKEIVYEYYPVMEVLAEAVQRYPEYNEESDEKKDPAEYAWDVTIVNGELQE